MTFQKTNFYLIKHDQKTRNMKIADQPTLKENFTNFILPTRIRKLVPERFIVCGIENKTYHALSYPVSRAKAYDKFMLLSEQRRKEEEGSKIWERLIVVPYTKWRRWENYFKNATKTKAEF